MTATTTSDQLEIRFTANDDAVQAIIVAGPRPPADPPESVTIPVDLDHRATVELLGHRGSLAWRSIAGGIMVTLPGAPTGSPAIALRMTPPVAVRPAV